MRKRDWGQRERERKKIERERERDNPAKITNSFFIFYIEIHQVLYVGSINPPPHSPAKKN